MNKRGFTLIEILIGLALVSMVFLVAATVLFSSFKSSRKTSAVAMAKAEGAYVIRLVSDMIKFAPKVTCSADYLRIQVDRKDLSSGVYLFDNTVTPTNISYKSGTLDGYDGVVDLDLTSNKVIVSLAECGGKMFDCTDQNRTVSICFAIDNAAGADVSDKALGTGGGIVFKTQVTLVNEAN